MKRISVVQQEGIQWATPAVEDVPPGGTDEVFVGLVSRVIWDEGRPLDDHGDLESPRPLRREARPRGPVRARGPVPLLSI